MAAMWKPSTTFRPSNDDEAAEVKGPTYTVTTSPALHRLLLDCQTWCTVDCCKEKAFQFAETSIARWLEHERVDRCQEIAEEIRRIKADLQRAEGQISLSARGLESGWDAGDFMAFWGRFEAAFAQAVDARKRSGA